MMNMNILTFSFSSKKFKRLAACLMLLSLLLLATHQYPASAEWQKPIQPSIAGGALTCLTLHPLEQSKFLVASKSQIFESSKENAWLLLWSAADPRTPIQKLVTFPILPEQVFVLTSNALFMGNLKDRSWQMVYKDTNKILLSFAVHPQNPNHWFLGTQKGLWESENAGKTWYHSQVFSRSVSVPLLFFDRNRLFLADDSSLYLAFAENKENATEKAGSVSFPQARIIFSIPKKELDALSQDSSQNDDNADEMSLYPLKIRHIIRAKPGQSLFLATQEGVFESLDEGYHWLPLSQSGLQSLFIYELAYSEKEQKLFAATDKGVYAYETKKHCWQKLSEGLAKDKTRSIAVLNENELIAITAEGFVQHPLEGFRPEVGPGVLIYQPSPKILFLFKRLIELEPNARELHKKVIRYANVSNGKIKRWHMTSRLAGLVPTVSYGRDFSSANNIDLDRGGTNDADRFISGPNDTNSGWDARVAWNLGDAIYSSNQTSIDSREKMMVELRNDLLSEATRIYYERRRLQIGLIFNPSTSEQDHLENLLRLDELTALLDSLTNGFFTERLERIYDEHPELNTLWIFQQNKEK